MIYNSWNLERDRLKFIILGQFLPFYPRKNQKNQNFEKMKKFTGDIIILRVCTKNHNHMMYGSWDTEWDGQNFCHFGPFFAILPGKSKFWEQEKSTWKCYHFTHVYQKLWSYDVCFLRYGVRQTEFFAILGDFLPFYTPTTRKTKTLKKWKKTLEILSFYTCVP